MCVFCNTTINLIDNRCKTHDKSLKLSKGTKTKRYKNEILGFKNRVLKFISTYKCPPISFLPLLVLFLPDDTPFSLNLYSSWFAVVTRMYEYVKLRINTTISDNKPPGYRMYTNTKVNHTYHIPKLLMLTPFALFVVKPSRTEDLTTGNVSPSSPRRRRRASYRLVALRSILLTITDCE